MCKEFGWTIGQLYAMPYRKLEKFSTIMRIEAQINKSKADQQNKGLKR